MGKLLEFKKIIRKTNKMELDTDTEDSFTEDLLYTRKEITINLDEIDYVLNCVYKQLLINNKLIISSENSSDFTKLTYLKDFNDKLNDIMYFLTNSVYKDPVIITIDFSELKYLLGTLQLEIEVLGKSKDENSSYSFKALKTLYSRLFCLYKPWEKEILKEWILLQSKETLNIFLVNLYLSVIIRLYYSVYLMVSTFIFVKSVYIRF